VQEFSSIIVEKDAIVKDCSEVEKLRIINTRSDKLPIIQFVRKKNFK
jgi:hypothetical protein